MLTPQVQEDRLWNDVIELLGRGGRLARYYRLPHHELQAILKLHADSADRGLQKIFSLLQRGRSEEASTWALVQGENKVFAMIHLLARGTRCWIETESPSLTIRSRWRVAHG